MKIFKDNFGKIHDPDGNNNCGFYTLFKAWKNLKKGLKNRKLQTSAANKFVARKRRKVLLDFGLNNVTLCLAPQ